MIAKTLTEWLFDLEARHKEEIQLGLERVLSVAKPFGLLETEACVITVGGTNGKGSTVTLLESIYHEAGYKVAAYTSPHVRNFTERVKLNKKPISESDFVFALDVIETARGSVALTYFEMVTLAALWHFKQSELELIILEVGLGGRLDATNILENDLAIITGVDFDHEAYLGKTLEAIGYEKAGILRQTKPLIYADLNPPMTVLTQASLMDCPTYILGRDYEYKKTEQGLHFQLKQPDANKNLNLPGSRLHTNSLAAVVMASFCLQERLPLDLKSLASGIEKASLPGRLHWIFQPRLTLFDVAHNPQSVDYLAKYLRENAVGRRIRAVFSSLADKNMPAMLSPLKALVSDWYPTLLPGKRAASLEQLEAAFKANGIDIDLCYTKPELAYQAACTQAMGEDLILVYGSFVLVGLLLPREDDENYP